MMPNINPVVPNPLPAPDDSYELFGYKIAKNKALLGLGALILASACLLYTKGNKGIIFSVFSGITFGNTHQVQKFANNAISNNKI